MRRVLNRRLFGASLLASTGVLSVQRMRTSGRISDRRRPRARVAILHADSYARSLEERITDGLRLFGLEFRGKTILLKPNLVQYIPGAEVNTNPLLVGPAQPDSGHRRVGLESERAGSAPLRSRLRPRPEILVDCLCQFVTNRWIASSHRCATLSSSV